MAQSMTVHTHTSTRTRGIRIVLVVVLVLNLAVAAAKLIYGTLSGSASMQADGVHSFFDSAGNVVGLIGIGIATRPADEGHPYGHTKFETYASMCIGFLLLLAALEVGGSAIMDLSQGHYDVHVTPISFAVMVVTLCINLFVTLFERKRAAVLESEVLAADAMHTLSDALVSCGVIVGLAFAALGFPIADPIMALAVTVAILHTAYGVFRTAFDTLSDHARIPEDQVREVVMSQPGVIDAHRIRTRGAAGEIYVDLHVIVDPQTTVHDAHKLADKTEALLKSCFDGVCEVLVHIEPDEAESYEDRVHE